jgi:hypothetical protein
MSENAEKLRMASVHLPNLSGGMLEQAAFIVSAFAQTVAGNIFELTINPEQYARNFTVRHICPPEIGASMNQAHSQFSKVLPETLELRFTIDGTGVVPLQKEGVDLVTREFTRNGNDLTGFVAAKLTQLNLVVYGIQGESHRPPFILINWGKLVFLGVLQGMTQTHTLFHSSGLPLRVEVNLKIQEFKMPSAILAALSLLSPDLTRKRMVKSSDTILTLTKNVYEKTDYYIEVAKANELTNFRRLKTGTELLFPPVV